LKKKRGRAEEAHKKEELMQERVFLRETEGMGGMWKGTTKRGERLQTQRNKGKSSRRKFGREQQGLINQCREPKTNCTSGGKGPL